MIPTEVKKTQQDVERAVFFSFGMFIIDEIEYLPPHPPKPKLTNLPGGAGLYALLGARLLSPPPTSRNLKWLLDAGSDFPSAIASQINTWTTGTQIRVDDSRLTTRAWNGYGHNESRAFKYLTPKRRLDVDDLPDPWVGSRSWHMVCSAERCMEIVNDIDVRRQSLSLNSSTNHNTDPQNYHDNNKGTDHSSSNRGITIWEPIPDLCTPQELVHLRAVMQSGKVDVMSPNREELGLYFQSHDDMSTEAMVCEAMGWDSHDLVDGTESVGYNGTGNGNSAVCVVREGADGSTIYFPPSPSLLSPLRSVSASTTATQSNTTNTSTNVPSHTKPRHTQTRTIHLPAYHTKSTAHLVTDPTGGGNTYLGALACALAYTIPWFSTPQPAPSTAGLITGAEASVEPAAGSAPTPTRPSSIPTSIMKAILFAESHSQSPSPSMAYTPISKAFLAAGICACVAASFAIEQSGVPASSFDRTGRVIGDSNQETKGLDEGDEEAEVDEYWGTGESRGRVGDRLDGYIGRLRGLELGFLDGR